MILLLLLRKCIRPVRFLITTTTIASQRPMRASGCVAHTSVSQTLALQVERTRTHVAANCPGARESAAATSMFSFCFVSDAKPRHLRQQHCPGNTVQAHVIARCMLRRGAAAQPWAPTASLARHRERLASRVSPLMARRSSQVSEQTRRRPLPFGPATVDLSPPVRQFQSEHPSAQSLRPVLSPPAPYLAPS